MKVYTGMKKAESLTVEIRDFYMRFLIVHHHNSVVFLLSSENLPTLGRITPKDYSNFYNTMKYA
jgi:hypothetical protein